MSAEPEKKNLAVGIGTPDCVASAADLQAAAKAGLLALDRLVALTEKAGSDIEALAADAAGLGIAREMHHAG
ncbi:MAG: hypothetical protein NZ694_02235 [Tepidimonas sp.]|uniref:Uncharacterized protein n=1 Tax=Tepidimonas ignava TaxID=114249 RepID=A0A4R3L886_9BURK|nr:hypothetical protein [Tepidimonas ignava]MCS6810072.1 hypothetical protein [Tepidimonas sp.]MCX7692686.1 hypothetical protein [Tepidimonas taiwanensis]TCS95255.1 hypothetical protein EDC36_1152 [Tepidimonas ignava]TSE19806.1 hypothetical protein Tigna_02135 [Tepidimonas ignava]